MSEAYERDSFFVAYLKWHYGRGLHEFFGVVQNFLWFINHFFSFRLFSQTLFEPWLLFRFGNLPMRFLGLISRLAILVVGFSASLVVLGLSGLALLVWVLAPAIFLGSAVLAIIFFNI